MADIKNITEATFEDDVLRSDRPVIVDFWAAWCVDCHRVAPELERLADKYAGVVDVAKLDVDANPALAAAFGIMRLPTIALFRPGQGPVGVTGFRRAEQLEQGLGLVALAPMSAGAG